MEKTNKNFIGVLVVLVLAVITVSLIFDPNFRFAGFATTQNGTVSVTISSSVDLIAIDSTTDLGSLLPGNSNSTDTLTTQRMEFGNNGTSKMQVTVLAGTDLWARTCPSGTAATNNSNNDCFNISCEDTLLEQLSGSASACAAAFKASVVNFNQTPISGSATFVTDLLGRGATWSTPGDNFTVGWSVHAPLNEPSGAKSVQIVFTASEDTT